MFAQTSFQAVLSFSLHASTFKQTYNATQVIGADLIVSAIGVTPANSWLPPELVRAEDGGLLVDRGMCCCSTAANTAQPTVPCSEVVNESVTQQSLQGIPAGSVFAGEKLCIIQFVSAVYGSAFAGKELHTSACLQVSCGFVMCFVR